VRWVSGSRVAGRPPWIYIIGRAAVWFAEALEDTAGLPCDGMPSRSLDRDRANIDRVTARTCTVKLDLSSCTFWAGLVFFPTEYTDILLC
jgi:hypothetical protein